MTRTEQTYVKAFRNVIRAVSDVNCYVTTPLRNQIDALEARIGDEDRIEELREIAHNV